MLKRRMRNLAVTGITVVTATILTALFTTGASASVTATANPGHVNAAASTSAAAGSATTGARDGGKAVAVPAVNFCEEPNFCAQTENGHAPLFRPNNSLWGTLPLNDYVVFSCWYYGSSPGWLNDGYEEHVVFVNGVGKFTGHIPDDYVNLGGLVPPAAGIPQCQPT